MLPANVEQLGVEVFQNCREGLRDVDVVIMKRKKKERMQGGFIPSEHEYFQLYGDFIPRLSILDVIFNIGPEDTLKKLNQI